MSLLILTTPEILEFPERHWIQDCLKNKFRTGWEQGQISRRSTVFRRIPIKTIHLHSVRYDRRSRPVIQSPSSVSFHGGIIFTATSSSITPSAMEQDLLRGGGVGFFALPDLQGRMLERTGE